MPWVNSSLWPVQSRNVLKRMLTNISMQKLLNSHHAELATPVQADKEYWNLLFFGVYHPQKPNQIHVVSNNSAKFGDVSLNDMKPCCYGMVSRQWPSKKGFHLQDESACFRNSPSPAVAISGLHKVAQEGEDEYGTDVCTLCWKRFLHGRCLKVSLDCGGSHWQRKC